MRKDINFKIFFACHFQKHFKSLLVILPNQNFKQKMYKKALPPLIDHSTIILIMGTMAGEQSIAKQQYYANRGNLFWKIMFTIFEEEFSASYEDRKALVKKYNIGLWNVLQSCKREGSSDASITEETINDFESLHKQYPNIKYVFFESKAAAKYFQKHTAPQEGVTYITLPSTSGLNAGLTKEEKIAQWKTISQIALSK
jgi:hypoxanthine-DNA glycosylase